MVLFLTSTQVLANDLAPFNAADPDLNGLDAVMFYTTLVGCIQAKGSEMARTAAVVVGMCLQLLAAASDQAELLVCMSWYGLHD